jgi:ABC-type transport system involved in cytochrome c biogenesis permease component
MSFLAAVSVAGRLELLLEWRSRGRLMAIFAFAVLASVIAHYTLEPSLLRHPRNLAGSALSALFFASLLLSGWAADAQDSSAYRLLLVSPLDPAALYVARLIARWSALSAISFFYIPVNAVLLTGDFPSAGHMLAQLIVLLQVAWTLAALGSLFSAMLDQKGRGVALPVLILPASVPALVLASGSLEHAFLPQIQFTGAGLAAMVAPAVLYSTVGTLLFPYLYEDGPFTA